MSSLSSMRLSILISIWRWSDIPSRIQQHPEEVKEWEYGNLPIHRACANEKTPPDIIQALIESYPESLQTKCETLGRLPMHYLIRWNPCNIELIKWILDKYSKCASELDETGHTPLTYHLWFSTARNSMDVTKLLIEAQKQVVEICDKYGYSPLHHAAKQCNTEICKYLIELYPEALVKKTKSGLTPLNIVKTVDKTHILCDVLNEEEEKRFGVEKNNNDLKLEEKCEGDDKVHLDESNIKGKEEKKDDNIEE